MPGSDVGANRFKELLVAANGSFYLEFGRYLSEQAGAI
jgi:hypothetical protein